MLPGPLFQGQIHILVDLAVLTLANTAAHSALWMRREEPHIAVFDLGVVRLLDGLEVLLSLPSAGGLGSRSGSFLLRFGVGEGNVEEAAVFVVHVCLTVACGWGGEVWSWKYEVPHIKIRDVAESDVDSLIVNFWMIFFRCCLELSQPL